MCGVIGIYFKKEVSAHDAEDIQRRCEEMLDTLSYRGPDERSLVRMGPAMLGHTRLSIIDLVSGSQPVYNEDKSVAVVLNGEIYNFRELRSELQSNGHRFSTRSDTEVIAHLYEDIGENVFARLTGMFSIIIYDSRKKLLLAGRDRIGEKPLIYLDDDEQFVAASELKALLKFLPTGNQIDSDALSLYFNCMYVPAPFTVFKKFKKLLPGHYIKITKGITELNKYWSPELDVQWGWAEKDIIGEFQFLFKKAVTDRIVSDVPIGVFLSGGIDSSAVTAFMAGCCPKIKTFSLGFAEEIDERPYARLVADRYCTDHTEILIEDKVEDVFEKVIGYFDEPFGDSSAIPTYLVSREARKHVKVILTGDGGDELFAGYDAYLNQKYLLGGRIGSRLFKEICNGFRFNRNGIFESLYPRTSGQYADKHWSLTRSIFNSDELRDIFCDKPFNPDLFFEREKWLTLSNRDALSRAFAYDLNFYLPDDLLKKVDMASMLTSIECRAPFLDHTLIEFAMKIPPQLKLKNDTLKYLLRHALKEYLPEEILNRPKHGFGAPVENWLRKPLCEMTRDYLAAGCRIEMLVGRDVITTALDAVYKTDKCTDYRTPFKLWLFLVLEVWMRKYN